MHRIALLILGLSLSVMGQMTHPNQAAVDECLQKANTVVNNPGNKHQYPSVVGAGDAGWEGIRETAPGWIDRSSGLPQATNPGYIRPDRMAYLEYRPDVVQLLGDTIKLAGQSFTEITVSPNGVVFLGGHTISQRSDLHALDPTNSEYASVLQGKIALYPLGTHLRMTDSSEIRFMRFYWDTWGQQENKPTLFVIEFNYFHTSITGHESKRVSVQVHLWGDGVIRYYYRTNSDLLEEYSPTSASFLRNVRHANNTFGVGVWNGGAYYPHSSDQVFSDYSQKRVNIFSTSSGLRPGWMAFDPTNRTSDNQRNGYHSFVEPGQDAQGQFIDMVFCNEGAMGLVAWDFSRDIATVSSLRGVQVKYQYQPFQPIPSGQQRRGLPLTWFFDERSSITSLNNESIGITGMFLNYFRDQLSCDVGSGQVCDHTITEDMFLPQLFESTAIETKLRTERRADAIKFGMAPGDHYYPSTPDDQPYYSGQTDYPFKLRIRELSFLPRDAAGVEIKFPTRITLNTPPILQWNEDSEQIPSLDLSTLRPSDAMWDFASTQWSLENPAGVPVHGQVVYDNSVPAQPRRIIRFQVTQPDWNGNATLVLRATNGSLTGTVNIQIRVLPVNDPPTFNGLPPLLTTEEGRPFPVIDLSDSKIVSDLETSMAHLSFRFDVPVGIQANWDPITRRLQLIPEAGTKGNIVQPLAITVMDRGSDGGGPSLSTTSYVQLQVLPGGWEVLPNSLRLTQVTGSGIFTGSFKTVRNTTELQVQRGRMILMQLPYLFVPVEIVQSEASQNVAGAWQPAEHRIQFASNVMLVNSAGAPVIALDQLLKTQKEILLEGVFTAMGHGESVLLKARADFSGPGGDLFVKNELTSEDVFRQSVSWYFSEPLRSLTLVVENEDNDLTQTKQIDLGAWKPALLQSGDGHSITWPLEDLSLTASRVYTYTLRATDLFGNTTVISASERTRPSYHLVSGTITGMFSEPIELRLGEHRLTLQPGQTDFKFDRVADGQYTLEVRGTSLFAEPYEQPVQVKRNPVSGLAIHVAPKNLLANSGHRVYQEPGNGDLVFLFALNQEVDGEFPSAILLNWEQPGFALQSRTLPVHSGEWARKVLFTKGPHWEIRIPASRIRSEIAMATGVPGGPWPLGSNVRFVGSRLLTRIDAYATTFRQAEWSFPQSGHMPLVYQPVDAAVSVLNYSGAGPLQVFAEASNTNPGARVVVLAEPIGEDLGGFATSTTHPLTPVVASNLRNATTRAPIGYFHRANWYASHVPSLAQAKDNALSTVGAGNASLQVISDGAAAITHTYEVADLSAVYYPWAYVQPVGASGEFRGRVLGGRATQALPGVHAGVRQGRWVPLFTLPTGRDALAAWGQNLVTGDLSAAQRNAGIIPVSDVLQVTYDFSGSHNVEVVALGLMSCSRSQCLGSNPGFEWAHLPSYARNGTSAVIDLKDLRPDTDFRLKAHTVDGFGNLGPIIDLGVHRTGPQEDSDWVTVHREPASGDLILHADLGRNPNASLGYTFEIARDFVSSYRVQEQHLPFPSSWQAQQTVLPHLKRVIPTHALASEAQFALAESYHISIQSTWRKPQCTSTEPTEIRWGGFVLIGLNPCVVEEQKIVQVPATRQPGSILPIEVRPPPDPTIQVADADLEPYRITANIQVPTSAIPTPMSGDLRVRWTPGSSCLRQSDTILPFGPIFQPQDDGVIRLVPSLRASWSSSIGQVGGTQRLARQWIDHSQGQGGAFLPKVGAPALWSGGVFSQGIPRISMGFRVPQEGQYRLYLRGHGSTSENSRALAWGLDSVFRGRHELLVQESATHSWQELGLVALDSGFHTLDLAMLHPGVWVASLAVVPVEFAGDYQQGQWDTWSSHGYQFVLEARELPSDEDIQFHLSTVDRYGSSSTLVSAMYHTPAPELPVPAATLRLPGLVDNVLTGTPRPEIVVSLQHIAMAAPHQFDQLLAGDQALEVQWVHRQGQNGGVTETPVSWEIVGRQDSLWIISPIQDLSEITGEVGPDNAYMVRVRMRAQQGVGDWTYLWFGIREQRPVFAENATILFDLAGGQTRLRYVQGHVLEQEDLGQGNAMARVRGRWKVELGNGFAGIPAAREGYELYLDDLVMELQSNGLQWTATAISDPGRFTAWKIRGAGTAEPDTARSLRMPVRWGRFTLYLRTESMRLLHSAGNGYAPEYLGTIMVESLPEQAGAVIVDDKGLQRPTSTLVLGSSGILEPFAVTGDRFRLHNVVRHGPEREGFHLEACHAVFRTAATDSFYVQMSGLKDEGGTDECALATGPWLDFTLFHSESDKDSYRFFQPLNDTVMVSFLGAHLAELPPLRYTPYGLNPEESWTASDMEEEVFYGGWMWRLRQLRFQGPNLAGNRGGALLENFDIQLADALRDPQDAPIWIPGFAGAWVKGLPEVDAGRLHIFESAQTTFAGDLVHKRTSTEARIMQNVHYTYRSAQGWQAIATPRGQYTVAPQALEGAEVVLPTANRESSFPWNFPQGLTLPLQELVFNGQGWQALQAEAPFRALSGEYLEVQGDLLLTTSGVDYQVRYRKNQNRPFVLSSPTGSSLGLTSIDEFEWDADLYVLRLGSDAVPWPQTQLSLFNTRPGRVTDPMVRVSAEAFSLAAHEGWPVVRLDKPTLKIRLSFAEDVVSTGELSTDQSAGLLLDGRLHGRQLSATWKVESGEGLPLGPLGELGLSSIAMEYRRSSDDYSLDLQGNLKFGEVFQNFGLKDAQVLVDTFRLALRSPLTNPIFTGTEPTRSTGVQLEALRAQLESGAREFGISPRDLTGEADVSDKDFVRIRTGERPLTLAFRAANPESTEGVPANTTPAPAIILGMAHIGLEFTEDFPFSGFRRTQLQLDTLALGYSLESGTVKLEEIRTRALRSFDTLDLFRTAEHNVSVYNATLSAEFQKGPSTGTSGAFKIELAGLNLNGKNALLAKCPDEQNPRSHFTIGLDGGITSRFCVEYRDTLPIYREEGHTLVGLVGPIRLMNQTTWVPDRNGILFDISAQGGGKLDPMISVGASADLIFRDPAQSYANTLGWMEKRFNGQMRRVSLYPGYISLSRKGLLLERLTVSTESPTWRSAYYSAKSQELGSNDDCVGANDAACTDAEKAEVLGFGPLALTVDRVSLDYWRTASTGSAACEGAPPAVPAWNAENERWSDLTPNPSAQTGCMRLHLENRVNFDLFEQCDDIEWGFQFGVRGNITEFSDLDFYLKTDRSVTTQCKVAGLDLDLVGMTFTKKPEGGNRSYYGLFADRIQLTARRPEIYTVLGAEKPIYLRWNQFMATTEAGITALQPEESVSGLGMGLGYGSFELGPRDAYLPDTLKLKVLGLTMKAKVNYEKVFVRENRNRAILFENVEVSTGPTLGNARLSTGFSLNVNGRAPYVHPVQGDRLALHIPQIQLSNAVRGGGGLVYERVPRTSGVTCSDEPNECYWRLKVNGNVSIPSLVDNAAIDLSMVRPDEINTTGIEQGLITVQLSGGSRIPLGTTGLYITGLMGGLYDGYGQPSLSTACAVGSLPPGLKTEMAVFIEDQTGQALKGRLGVWVQLNALNFGIDGQAKLVNFLQAHMCAALMNNVFRARATVSLDSSITGSKLFVRGGFGVDVWSDRLGKNIAGYAKADVGIRRKALINRRWLKVPGSDKTFGGIFTNFGRFTNGKNGVTAGVRFWGTSWGLGMIGGSFKLGGLGGYKLAAPPGGYPTGVQEWYFQTEEAEDAYLQVRGGEIVTILVSADYVPFTPSVQVSVGETLIDPQHLVLDTIDNTLSISFDNSISNRVYTGPLGVRLEGVQDEALISMEAFSSLPVLPGSVTALAVLPSETDAQGRVSLSGTLPQFPVEAFDVLFNEDVADDEEFGYQFLEPVLLQRRATTTDLVGRTVELETVPEVRDLTLFAEISIDGHSSTSSGNSSSSSSAVGITVATITRAAEAGLDEEEPWRVIPVQSFVNGSETPDFYQDLSCVQTVGTPDALGRALLNLQGCELHGIPNNGGVYEFALGVRVWVASALESASSLTPAQKRALIVGDAMPELDTNSIRPALRPDGGSFFARLTPAPKPVEPVEDLRGYGSPWQSNWSGNNETRKARLRWTETNGDNPAVDAYRIYWKPVGAHFALASQVVPKGGYFEVDFPHATSSAGYEASTREEPSFTANRWEFTVVPVRRMQLTGANGAGEAFFEDYDQLEQHFTVDLSTGDATAPRNFKLQAPANILVVPSNQTDSIPMTLLLENPSATATQYQALVHSRWSRWPTGDSWVQSANTAASNPGDAVPMVSVSNQQVDLVHNTEFGVRVQPKVVDIPCRTLIRRRPVKKKEFPQESWLKNQSGYYILGGDDDTNVDLVLDANGNIPATADPSNGKEILPEGVWSMDDNDTLFYPDPCRSSNYENEDQPLASSSPLGLYLLDVAVVHDANRTAPTSTDAFGHSKYKSFQVVVAPAVGTIGNLNTQSVVMGRFNRIYFEMERLMPMSAMGLRPQLIIRDREATDGVKTELYTTELTSNHVVPVRIDTLWKFQEGQWRGEAVSRSTDHLRGIRVGIPATAFASLTYGQAAELVLRWEVPLPGGGVRYLETDALELDLINAAHTLCLSKDSPVLRGGVSNQNLPEESDPFVWRNQMSFLGVDRATASRDGFRLLFSELHYRMPEHWELEFEKGTQKWTFRLASTPAGANYYDNNPFLQFEEAAIRFRFPGNAPAWVLDGDVQVRARIRSRENEPEECDNLPLTTIHMVGALPELRLVQEGTRFRVEGLARGEKAFYRLGEGPLDRVHQRGLQRYRGPVALSQSTVVSVVASYREYPSLADARRVQQYMQIPLTLALRNAHTGATVPTGSTVDLGTTLLVQPLDVSGQTADASKFQSPQWVCSWNDGEEFPCVNGALADRLGTAKLSARIQEWTTVEGTLVPRILTTASWNLQITTSGEIFEYGMSCDKDPNQTGLQDYPLYIDFAKLDLSESQRDLMRNSTDIHFRDESMRELPFEVEYHDSETGVRRVWVRIPQYQGACQKIRILAGAPKDVVPGRGVWNSNYAGVWHFSPEQGPLRSDRVAGLELLGSDNTQFSPLTQGLTLEGARSFSRSPLDGSLEAFTVSSWVRLGQVPTTSSELLVVRNSQQLPYLRMQVAEDSTLSVEWSGNGEEWKTVSLQTRSGAVDPGIWNLVAFSWNRNEGGQLALYVNGQLLASGSIDTRWHLPSDIELSLGNSALPEVAIDELRFHRRAMTKEWLLTDYLTQRGKMYPPSTTIRDAGCPGRILVNPSVGAGDYVYADHDHRIHNLPSSLAGGALLLTLQGENQNTEDPYVCFEVQHNAEVFLMLDTAYRKAPEFLDSWTQVEAGSLNGEYMVDRGTRQAGAVTPMGGGTYTDAQGEESYAFVDQSDWNAYHARFRAFQVYKRKFEAGVISVPGPASGGAYGHQMQYSMVVKPDLTGSCYAETNSSQARLLPNFQVGVNFDRQGDLVAMGANPELIGLDYLQVRDAAVAVGDIGVSTCRSAHIYLALPATHVLSGALGWEPTPHTLLAGSRTGDGRLYRVYRRFHLGGELAPTLLPAVNTLMPGEAWFVLLGLSPQGQDQTGSPVVTPNLIPGAGNSEKGDGSPELTTTESLVLDPAGAKDKFLVLRFPGPVRLRLGYGPEMSQVDAWLQRHEWQRNTSLRWTMADGTRLQFREQEFWEPEENVVVVPTAYLEGLQVNAKRWVLFYEMLETQSQAYNLEALRIRSIQALQVASPTYTLKDVDFHPISGQARSRVYRMALRNTGVLSQDVARPVVFVRNVEVGTVEAESGEFIILDRQAKLADIAPFLLDADSVWVNALDLSAKGYVEVHLRNLSANDIWQPFWVKIYEDLDANFNPDAGDRVIGQSLVSSLRAGQTARIRIPMNGAASYPGSVLLAIANGDGWVPETDFTNNLVLGAEPCNAAKAYLVQPGVSLHADLAQRQLQWVQWQGVDYVWSILDNELQVHIPETGALVRSIALASNTTEVQLRDANGDGQPNWVLTHQILDWQGQVLLDLLQSGPWVGSNAFDLDGDGFRDQFAASGVCPQVFSGRTGELLGEGCVHTIPATPPLSCMDAVLSYPRWDVLEDNSAMLWVRLANGGTESIPADAVVVVTHNDQEVARVAAHREIAPRGYVDLPLIQVQEKSGLWSLKLELPNTFADVRIEQSTFNNSLSLTEN